ncbi:MAG: restriction endonuclease subunit S [Defluviitaleaceae bacterium]|nr:restriction endonuclease subunit S [Defluviitaleaceae bacterium]
MIGKWEMVRLGDVSTGKVTNIAQKDLADNEGEYPIYGASGLIKHVDFYREEQPYIGVVKDGAGVGRTTLMPAQSSLIGTMQYILPNDNVDVGFLYYTVTRMNLARFFTGATIPHIYYKDYKNEQMLLPPLDVQKKIADVLDRATALIEKRKAQIAKLDLLVKAKFVDMFGDPVLNPKGWNTERLGDVCALKSGKFISATEIFSERIDGFFPCYGGNGVRGYVGRYSHEGDFPIIGRQGALCGNVQYVRGKFYATEHAVVVSAKANLNALWLSYLLDKKNLNQLASGAAQPGLTVEKLNSVTILMPPTEMQNGFADFVRQVEKSKAQMQHGLGKLELLYKSLMQKCFAGEMF